MNSWVFWILQKRQTNKQKPTLSRYLPPPLHLSTKDSYAPHIILTALARMQSLFLILRFQFKTTFIFHTKNLVKFWKSLLGNLV